MNMCPTLQKVGIAGSAAVSILITLCLVCALAPLQTGSDARAQAQAEASAEPLTSHRMTGGEMSAYRTLFGVRDPAADYNILIDGHGTGKAPPTEQAYDAMVGQLNVLDSVEPMVLPTAFDLSVSPSFPKVGNQASQGSCTAWAVTYYAFGYIEAVDYGWTEAKSGNASQLLSPAWTYNKVNGGVDGGSWEWDNMRVLKDWGTSTMALLPYDDTDWTDWGSPAAFREAPLHRVREAFQVPYEGASTVEAVKTLVCAGTPVTFGVDAGNYKEGFRDDNFIISSAEYHVRYPNHANTFVGFDDSVTDDGEAGAFRVVNSWGSTWGDAGYYWLTYDAFMEMGDYLDLCFVQDIEDYSPSMRAVWHFDPAPTRDVSTTVAIGAYDAPVEIKIPYYWPSGDVTLRFPTYMCVDITEFEDAYDAGTNDFYIAMEEGIEPGAIAGLKVELFENAHNPSAPTQSSGEAWNDPQAIPCHVDLSFPYYSPISLTEAMEADMSVATDGDVFWVGVDNEWSRNGDAAQSGNIGDFEESRMTADVLGPVTIGFEWKTSCGLASSRLTFGVDGADRYTISGDVDWHAKTYELGPGAHEVSWTYSRGDGGSDLDDCCWVDNVTITYPPGLEPPVAYFEFYPSEGNTTTVFLFSASGSYDPDHPEAVLWARWDWDGDGTWDTDWSQELTQYHSFDAPGEHTVRLRVMDSDGLTDECERQVTVVELIPEFGELAGSMAASIMALMVIAVSARRRRGRSGASQRGFLRALPRHDPSDVVARYR